MLSDDVKEMLNSLNLAVTRTLYSLNASRPVKSRDVYDVSTLATMLSSIWPSPASCVNTIV